MNDRGEKLVFWQVHAWHKLGHVFGDNFSHPFFFHTSFQVFFSLGYSLAQFVENRFPCRPCRSLSPVERNEKKLAKTWTYFMGSNIHFMSHFISSPQGSTLTDWLTEWLTDWLNHFIILNLVYIYVTTYFNNVFKLLLPYRDFDITKKAGRRPILISARVSNFKSELTTRFYAFSTLQALASWWKCSASSCNYGFTALIFSHVHVMVKNEEKVRLPSRSILMWNIFLLHPEKVHDLLCSALEGCSMAIINGGNDFTSLDAVTFTTRRST